VEAENLIIIKDLEGMERLKNAIPRDAYVAFDTETNGVDRESHIIGFSVSWDTTAGYYVVLRAWDPVNGILVDLPTVSKAKEFMEHAW
jgi:hypothetical protein